MIAFLAMIPLPSLRLLLLGGAAAILYIVGRLVMNAIPRRIDSSSLRAMLGAITVLVVGATAVLMDRPQVGLHLPIAAAAGALTLGMGSILLGRGAPTTPGGGLRSWMFVLPAVALVLIGGFGGRADGWMLAALIAYGGVALSAWLPDRANPRTTPTNVVGETSAPVSAIVSAGTFGDTVVTEATPKAYAAPDTASPRARERDGSHAFATLVWLGSVFLAVLAGVMAMQGLPALESMRHVPADALVAVFLLSPAIVVPLVFELLPPCRPVGWTASISTVTKFAVMCLCIVLPSIVMVAASVGVVRGWGRVAETASATTMPATNATMATTAPATTMTSNAISTTQPIVETRPTLTFPSLPQLALSTDLLVMAAASLMLLPIAGGWLRPGKLEAAALFVCYGLNLLLIISAMVS